jgi:hypothetical protein
MSSIREDTLSYSLHSIIYNQRSNKMIKVPLLDVSYSRADSSAPFQVIYKNIAFCLGTP